MSTLSTLVSQILGANHGWRFTTHMRIYKPTPHVLKRILNVNITKSHYWPKSIIPSKKYAAEGNSFRYTGGPTKY